MLFRSCFSVGSHNLPFNNNFSSVTLGFLLNDNFKKKVKFWNDKSIKTKEVNDTCERCLISNCKERVAKPVQAEQQMKFANIQDIMKEMIEALNKK